MKTPFPPLLKSAPRSSRTLISISVKKRQLFRPAPRMTTKRWYGCPSGLWTSEKSRFSTCRLGGRKHLIFRLGSRYHLRLNRKARRRLLCYPGSRRFGSVPRASLFRGRGEAFRLLPRIHVSNEIFSLPASRLSFADLVATDCVFDVYISTTFPCFLSSRWFFFVRPLFFLVSFLFVIHSTFVFIIFSSLPLFSI